MNDLAARRISTGTGKFRMAIANIRYDHPRKMSAIPTDRLRNQGAALKKILFRSRDWHGALKIRGLVFHSDERPRIRLIHGSCSISADALETNHCSDL